MSELKEELAAGEAKLEADGVTVRSDAVKVWQRWEPYFCLAAGLVGGFLLAHWIARL